MDRSVIRTSAAVAATLLVVAFAAPAIGRRAPFAKNIPTGGDAAYCQRVQYSSLRRPPFDELVLAEPTSDQARMGTTNWSSTALRLRAPFRVC
jgi:hypothetical protein